MRSYVKSAAALLLAAAVTISVSGCTSATGSAGGDGVTVMVFGSFSQPPFPLRQIETAAEAAVAEINQDGGINGTKIDLVSCDDNGNANGAALCGRQAVQKKVAAVVEAFTLFGDNIVPLLESAKIPYILPAAVSAKEFSSDISFPVMSAQAPTAAALLALKKQGCRTVIATASQNAQSDAAYATFEVPLAKRIGVKTAKVYYPPTTTDFSSVAARIRDAGDCVVFHGGSQDTAALVTAIAQTGADLKQVALSTIAVPTSTLVQLKGGADGMQVFAPLYYPSTKKPAVTKAVGAIKAQDDSATIDDTALNAYAAVLTFAAVAADVPGDLTGPAMIKQLRTPGKTIDTGMYAPTDFSADAGFWSDLPRVAGHTFQSYVAKGGEWVPEGDPIELKGRLGS